MGQMRTFLLPSFALSLLSPLLVAAHGNTFPLPIPAKIKLSHDASSSPYRRARPRSPEGLRTRVVEDAVRRAGGWVRWRAVESLYLRVHRRRLDAQGEVFSNEEENLILGQNSFTRYWQHQRNAYAAAIVGPDFRLLEPTLPRGDPRLVDIRQAMEREMFWLAHPFLLYRPGIHTRYLGTTYSRGLRTHVLRVEYSVGASPYRKVEYQFDQHTGDLVRATAWPGEEGQPVEEIHFSGRVTSKSGLRLPRRREILIEGIVREVWVLRNLAAKNNWLPASPFSEEGRHRRLRSLASLQLSQIGK
jgi:hypothetical protein